MLGALGLIFPEVFHLPFYTSPSFPAATSTHDAFVSSGAMKQILLWVGFAEVFGALGLRETLEGDRAPGYFGLDPLGLGKDPKMAAREIKNGRYAFETTLHIPSYPSTSVDKLTSCLLSSPPRTDSR
jgi:hypothetical protein